MSHTNPNIRYAARLAKAMLTWLAIGLGGSILLAFTLGGSGTPTWVFFILGMPIGALGAAVALFVWNRSS